MLTRDEVLNGALTPYIYILGKTGNSVTLASGWNARSILSNDSAYHVLMAKDGNCLIYKSHPIPNNDNRNIKVRNLFNQYRAVPDRCRPSRARPR